MSHLILKYDLPGRLRNLLSPQIVKEVFVTLLTVIVVGTGY
jgi:hypothetical protein